MGGLVVEKRLSRRQMRKDPLLTWTARGETYLEENWQRLLIAAGALALVVVLVLFLRNSRRNAELTASETLAQAQVQLWTGNPTEAAQIAGQVIERSPGTRSGRIAYLVRGDALLKMGDREGAATAYRAFLEQEKRDPVLRLSAKRGLAVALEDGGFFAGAAELYEELAREELAREAKRKERPGGIAAGDLMAAARCRERAGDLARARALYEEVVSKYLKDAVASDAKLRLAELGRSSMVAPAAAPGEAGREAAPRRTP